MCSPYYLSSLFLFVHRHGAFRWSSLTSETSTLNYDEIDDPFHYLSTVSFEFSLNASNFFIEAPQLNLLYECSTEVVLCITKCGVAEAC